MDLYLLCEQCFNNLLRKMSVAKLVIWKNEIYRFTWCLSQIFTIYFSVLVKLILVLALVSALVLGLS